MSQSSAPTESKKTAILGQSAEQSSSAQAQPRQQGRRKPFLLVLILDATLSMEPYVEGVHRALHGMLDQLAAAGLDAILAMEIFRDETEGEMPEIYPLGASAHELKAVLDRTPSMGGGSRPESSYPAIMNAIDLVKDQDASLPRIFLHVTDAPPHDPEQGHTANSVLRALKQERILFFCCTPEIEPYVSFANATGGTLFPIHPKMDAKAFEQVLMEFTKTTIKTIPVAPGALSPEVQALLDQTEVDR